MIMSLRYATLFAAIALVAAPFAGAMGNIDVTGDLMLMWFSSDNTVDFDDEGTASGTFHSSGDDGMVTTIEDQVTFMRQEGHLYFTVDDLGGDNVMVKIGLEVDRALESGALPGSSYLVPSAAGPTGDNLSSTGLGSPTVDNDPGLDVFVEEAYLKIAQIYDTALTVMVDVFNLFDSDTVLDVQERWGTFEYDYISYPDQDSGSEYNVFVPGASFGLPTDTEDPREIRLGARFTF